MNRRGFIAFLVAAPVTRSLPWQAIASIAPAPLAEAINLSLSDIITTTIRKHTPELIANLTANNALLTRLKAGR